MAGQLRPCVLLLTLFGYQLAPRVLRVPPTFIKERLR